MTRLSIGFLAFIAYSLLPFSTNQLLASIPLAGSKPNIIFILADDLGWQDVGFMGSTFYETPHLDKLASQSLVLTNSYMYPSCSPSRTALATGKHSFRTNVYRVPVLERGGGSKDNLYSRWTVETRHTHYARPLNDAGYKLIHLGKWHLVGPDPKLEADTFPFRKKLVQPGNGNFDWLASHQTPEIQTYYPQGRGYHENVGGTWWGDPARGYDKGYRTDSGGYIAPFKNPFIKDKPTDKWLTDRLTDDAIDFIKRHKSSPFFVSLHFYSPHRPSIATDAKTLKKYLNKPACPVTGQSGKTKKEIAAYATMVENLDMNVGRLVAYLDKAGLRENTMIIFTSDNGFNAAQSLSKNLRGNKTTHYEGGLLVPTLVNYQNRIAPRRDDTPVICIDYFPTFMSLAGVNYKGQLDGNSLTPLFEDKTLHRQGPLFWHLASHQPVTVMRKGKYKLIQYLLKENKVELYDLENDKLESRNLVHTHPEIAANLIKELTYWRKQNNVQLPAASPLDY